MDLFSLDFNPAPPTVLHIDLNSCFATIEQQANPHLRGRPVAVAAYDSPGGCILAPSVEAKALGIKVGMRVRDGRLLCPDLAVFTPDVWKYRFVHQRLRKLLSEYTENLAPKSIDEFVLNLKGYPVLRRGMLVIGREIKERIKQEIGEWLTVSIGIGPNRFLAKLASNLHKPDGLDMIDQSNFWEIYQKLELPDLCGIASQNTLRLNMVGVYTVADFYRADVRRLKAAFQSILGRYWYMRLRGWEVDEIDFGRKSFGNSFALPKPLAKKSEFTPILTKLVVKSGQRLRKAGFQTRGVHLGILYRDYTFWHRGRKLREPIFASQDIAREIFRTLHLCPYEKPVRELSIACFSLIPAGITQLNLFDDVCKRLRLEQAIDRENERWGDFVLRPARMLNTDDVVHDRIAFGAVKELHTA